LERFVAQFYYGFCLANGRGVPGDLEKSVHCVKLAADQGIANAQFNYGLCLSAEMKNAAAQNSFGICLERGIGAHKNLLLAAQFCRPAADQGHADGANNFGFCLEHGPGVEQSFEMAAKYYGFAAERGHPEAKLNCARCMHLLGRWEPPDRSSDAASHPPSADRLAEVFHPFLENPGRWTRMAGGCSVPYSG
jgi:TPR repeat protein